MINIVVPLAGEGTRFSSTGIKTPKPLIVVNGKTMIEHSVETLGIKGQYIFITKEYKNDAYNIELSSIIKRIQPDAIEIKVDKKQRGAADAVMYAEKYINNKDSLITINCDQILNWDPKEFLDHVKETNCDGSVVLFNANDPKHSYAEIVDNKIIKIVEKEVISNHALIGVHYWKHGADFVDSAKELLNTDSTSEVYISQTYSYMLKNGKSICIITYGMGVYWAKAAAKKFEGKIEIIDLRTIAPIDEDAIFNSARIHGKIMVLTEEPVNNGFSQSIAARISEHCFEYLDAPVKVIGSENLPAIPLNSILEKTMLPNAQKVEIAIEKLLNY